MRPIDSPQFIRTWINMDQLLLWIRNVENGITRRCHFTQTHANGNYQIRILNALHQLGIDADTDVTDIVWMFVVEMILKTKIDK